MLGVLGCAALLLSGCAAAPAATPESSTSPLEVDTPQPSAAPEDVPPPAETPPAFDRTAYSIDDPASLWVISNKQRPLQPTNWEPLDLEMPIGVANANAQPLRAPAARAIESMVQAAANAGIRLSITSAFRPFDYQAMLYHNYIARDGQTAADTYSARPGHSEHQTGLAVDVDDGTGCMLNACFGQTPGGLWVAEHAAEYGFVIRYPSGADAITGFTYEPWHLRYVGVELAQEMRVTGTNTLEEFFGLPAAPAYVAE